MVDHTTTTPVTKTCANGDKCVHPQGPNLPNTSEYFYVTKGGYLRKMCKECFKAYRREHHEVNKDHDNDRSKQYYRKDPERYKHYGAHYYARKRENGGKYTHADLDMAFRQQKGKCWYCGTFLGLTFDIDHRVPVSRGGHSDISNIVLCCRECNHSKGDKLPHEWNGRLL